MTKIDCAVFPVAGLGTRFLPATKANPKEMLPIVDKPLIQYAVEEAIAAGITKLIFVTSSSKRAIEDHFDTNHELEEMLAKKSQHDVLETVRNMLPPGVTACYVRQAEPLGLGHAVLCAKPLVGDKPFCVLLADDLIDGGDRHCLKDMVELFEQTGLGSVAVEQIKWEDTVKYGIISTEENQQQGLLINSIVEKPKPENAPSNLAAIGRYLLPGQIFGYLERTTQGVGGEIQLTDAIADLLAEQKLIAHRFFGTRYDCGSKLGYLKAVVSYGLKHPDVGERFKAHLSEQAKWLTEMNQ